MTNWDSKKLGDIAKELKSIRLVLERMAQAPMFEKRDTFNISLNAEEVKVALSPKDTKDESQ